MSRNGRQQPPAPHASQPTRRVNQSAYKGRSYADVAATWACVRCGWRHERSTRLCPWCSPVQAKGSTGSEATLRAEIKKLKAQVASKAAPVQVDDDDAPMEKSEEREVDLEALQKHLQGLSAVLGTEVPEVKAIAARIQDEKTRRVQAKHPLTRARDAERVLERKHKAKKNADEAMATARKVIDDAIAAAEQCRTALDEAEEAVRIAQADLDTARLAVAADAPLVPPQQQDSTAEDRYQWLTSLVSTPAGVFAQRLLDELDAAARADPSATPVPAPTQPASSQQLAIANGGLRRQNPVESGQPDGSTQVCQPESKKSRS